MTVAAAIDFAARRRDVARAIQRRLVAHIAAGGTTDFAPAPMENDAAVYTDPARAEIERRNLFLNLPLIAGFSLDVPQAGDILLFEDAGPSIIIVRGMDGRLRGFLNMCTHRGSKLVRPDRHETCERPGRLTCPFHAWSFHLDGTLAVVPGRPGFEGLDLTQRNLVAVPVSEWNGVIFVRASAGSEPLDAEGFLGGFAPELAQLELGNAAPIKSSAMTAATNWKLALDTYAEGYHFGTLHASTIGRTHFSNVAAFDDFAPHWRLSFPEKSMRRLAALPEADWPEADYGGIHFVFPNTVLVVGSVEPGEGFVRMFRVYPGDTPGLMTCRVSVYAPGGIRSEEHLAEFARDDMDSEVTQEDYRVAVGAYANMLSAPRGFKVVYGRNEPALQSLHRSVAGALGVEA